MKFFPITTLADITSVVAGTGLSGGGTSGDVTLNVDFPISSANLDADTAHLSNAQSFTGAKTFALPIISDGDRTLAPGDGAAIHVDAFDVTDGTTSASGTTASFRHVSIETPRLLATNSSVTTTDAATLYIKDAPLASTNQTITNAYALWVDAGNARFDGNIDLEGDIDVNGALETDALTIAGATIAAIGTTAITTLGTIGTGVWQGTTIKTAYIGDDQVTEDKLANSLLAEIDANTAKVTNSDQSKSDIDGLGITTVGTIDTGVWNGTAIASAYLDADTAHLSGSQTFTGTKTLNSFKGTGATTVTNILDEDAMGSDSATALATQQSIKAYVDAKKQVMHYPTKGYAVGDGTNYEFQKPMGTNTAPFNFDDEAMGPDGVSNVTTQKILRAGGIVMPRDCTLTRWTGWAVSAGSSADTFIGLFKVTIARNENTNYNFVELEEFQYTALGNNKAEDFDISSGFTETAIAAGDIIFPGLKGASGAIQYFSGTFEVEF